MDDIFRWEDTQARAQSNDFDPSKFSVPIGNTCELQAFCLPI